MVVNLHQVQIQLPARPQHRLKNINSTIFQNSKSSCIFFPTKCDLVLFQVSWQNLFFFLCSFDFFFFQKNVHKSNSYRDPLICYRWKCFILWKLNLLFGCVLFLTERALYLVLNNDWNKTYLEFPTIDYNCFYSRN